MVESLLRLSYFYSHESCGQCTPCREGTGWMWRVVERIQHRRGPPKGDLRLLNSVARRTSRAARFVRWGDAAAMPVRAMIKHFRPEFEALIRNKARKPPTSA